MSRKVIKCQYKKPTKLQYVKKCNMSNPYRYSIGHITFFFFRTTKLGVQFRNYLLLMVKITSRCRMDVPSSSKHDLASRSFFDPGHEMQLQREVFFTIQNVYFFHDFPPKRVRKRIKKNFDEKYTLCQLIWVAQVVFYHLDYPQSHPERPACLYINSYDHFIVVATSFRLRFLTSTARMRRAAKFFIWLC